MKTEYKAVGVDGAPGAAGPAGGEGTPGENGKYYVPNKETGCFDIYQDGKLVEATDISWKPQHLKVELLLFLMVMY